MLKKYLPVLGWLRGYDRRWLVADFVAGLSVWALLVPQSLAYATIVGVPVQYGLYTAFAALLLYPLFGTSRHLVVGPSATVGAVSAAVVAPLIGTAALGTDKAATYAAALALATAAVYLALGLLRMGWISTFLSKAVMSGFILGFAVGIVINQVHSLLGVPGVEGSYVQQLWGTVEAIPDTSGTTLAVGAASLAVLLVMRYLLPKLPRALIVVMLSIIAVEAFDLAEHGVAITGDVPTGLFSIGLPGIDWGDAGALLIGALAVVFVGYSETLAAARSLARKYSYELDTNQELVAQGMANGAAGLVGGFVVDGSLSKTSVADDAGQKTELASLINAAFVLATMLVLATLFENLPAATLGAIVIDAMVGLITLEAFQRYYRVNRVDWVFFVGAGLGILVFGIMAGILIGVILSLVMLIARSSRTNIRRLHRDPTSGSYHDVSRHDGAGADFRDRDRASRRPALLRRRRSVPRATARARPGGGSAVVRRGRCRSRPLDGHRRRRHADPGRGGVALARGDTCTRPRPSTGSRTLGTCRRDRRDRQGQGLRHGTRRGSQALRRLTKRMGATASFAETYSDHERDYAAL